MQTAITEPGDAAARPARQSRKLAERVELLASCGLDDWFRPASEFLEDDVRMLDLLLPIEQYEKLSTAERAPRESGPPSGCSKLKPGSPPPSKTMLSTHRISALSVGGVAGPCAPSCFFTQLAPAPQVSEAVRFAVIGDAGDSGDEDERKKGETIQQIVASRVRAVCSEAATQAGRCAFAVFLGDNLYPDGLSHDANRRARDEAELANLIGSYDLPAYVALGNHDWHPFWPRQERADRTLRFVHTQARMFGNAHFYDFEAGPVHLWALDTNYLVRVSGATGALEKHPWLARFKDTQGPWKIVFGHHPYLSNGAHGNAGEFDDVLRLGWQGKDYKKLLERHILGSADLVLSGHDHSLQFYPVARTGKQEAALVVSGAASKSGKPGRARNTGQNGTVAPVFQHYGPGFAIVEATKERLTVEMHRLESTGWIVWTISKNAGGAWELPAPAVPGPHQGAR